MDGFHNFHYSKKKKRNKIHPAEELYSTGGRFRNTIINPKNYKEREICATRCVQTHLHIEQRVIRHTGFIQVFSGHIIQSACC